VDAITRMLQDMERDRKRMEKKLAQLVIHLNGGISYIDAYGLSTDQITSLTEALNEHYEQQADAIKKSNKRS
jgi:methyl-accepting chemotaxis protein